MSKPLKEDYIIRIKSRIEQDGETEQVELMTRGSFAARGGSYYITYRETEATGYEGNVTTLKIAADASRVAMLRYGPQASQLIIEKGRRSLCHYETGYGSLTFGVTADDIECSLGKTGGTARFSYLLDGDVSTLVSKNTLEVTVTHVN